MNMLMMELLNVVTAAGLVPSKTTYNQMLTAIQQLSVSAVEQALAYKVPALVATTGANIALTGLQTIDGVLLAAGNRVLVKDQTNPQQNGIYVAAAGAWSLASDVNTAAELVPAMLVPVQAGTANADTVWQLKTQAPIVIGTSNIMFQEASANLAQFALLSQLQSGVNTFAVDSGAANAYVCAFTPAMTSRQEGQVIRFKVAHTNTTASTINDGAGTVPLVGGAHSALQGGEMMAGGDAWAQWNSTVGAGSYVLLFCTGAPEQVAAGTQSQHAVNLGQMNAALAAVGYRSGTLLMWPVPVAPSWALVRDGSAINRVAYAGLFAALCPTRSGTTANGSAAITGLSSTSDLYFGMPIEGVGIPAGATIASITSSSAITISANATASGTTAITLFYYGYGSGGSASTFGVPDDRGLFERGLDTARGYDQTTLSGSTTSGSAAITGLSTTKGLCFGQSVSGPGIPGGATVASVTSATAITISSNATASATVSIIFTGGQIGNERTDSMQGHVHSAHATAYMNAGITAGGNDTSSSEGNTGVPISDGINGTPRTGAETRPRNRAYLPIIVY
jgi:hypothetical protein